jgi:hypothetical protein
MMRTSFPEAMVNRNAKYGAFSMVDISVFEFARILIQAQS